MRKDLTTAKTLLVASITALSMTGAYASENLAPVPKEAEDNPKGTLDNLAGQDIPGSDPVQQYPSSGSSYIMTKVQEGGEKPTGDNIVTKFTYNSETKTMTPVYYRLDLKQTTYGGGNTSQTFTLDTEPVKGVEITAKYDDLSGKTYSKEYKDTNYTATVTSGGSKLDPKQEIHSVLQNTSGNTISIKNAIFKDNKMEIDFSTSNTYYLDVIGGAIYNAGTIEKITADFLKAELFIIIIMEQSVISQAISLATMHLLLLVLPGAELFIIIMEQSVISQAISLATMHLLLMVMPMAELFIIIMEQ